MTSTQTTQNTISSNQFTQVIVGSHNPSKVAAVREVLSDYNNLSFLEVVGMPVDSGISEQPLSLDEIILGAQNRALNAYQDKCLSVGLEGGMMMIPGADDEYLHINVCSLYDGEQHHLGMSTGFRVPKKVMRLILDEGLDFPQAMQKAGLTADPNIGLRDGAIGLFTDGRISRKEYCKQSLTTALISIQKPQYFDEDK